MSMRVAGGLSLLLVVVLLVVAPHGGVSYPTSLSCSQDLATTTTVMNSMMQPMSNAAAAQQHQFTVERDGTTLACDGTASVAQGDNLVVKVTGTLQSAVAASGWTAGVGPNYIVEVTQATALVRAMSPVGESRYAACPDSAGSNNRITSPGVDVLVTPVAAGELKIRLASAYGYGTVYLADECTLTATGTASVSTVSGFLVCKTMDNQLVTPFEHSLADLRACQVAPPLQPEASAMRCAALTQAVLRPVHRLRHHPGDV